MVLCGMANARSKERLPTHSPIRGTLATDGRTIGGGHGRAALGAPHPARVASWIGTVTAQVDVDPITLTSMKIKSILLTLALVTSASAIAVEPVPAVDGGDKKHHCIMADNDTWMKLGITPAQMPEVAAIRDACKNDYETAKNAGMPTADAVAMHEASLKRVLTPEQFLAWNNWCTEKMVHKEGMKSKEGMKKQDAR